MDNKIGIYYAFWEREWAADYRKYVDKVSRLGFDVLELAAGALPGMAPAERRALAAAAADAGLELTYCIGLPPEYDMAGEDAATRRRGIEYAKSLLDIIASMGGTLLGGIIYGCWPANMDFEMTDKRPWWDRSVASVREVAKTAEGLGVTYCLEVVNRFEQFLINTAAEGMRFVDDVGNPAVKLLLDTFHMNIEEDFIGDAIASAAGYIGHMHVGETNRRVPGRGHMPWAEFAEGLRRADYRGRVVMEPFLRMGGEVGKNIKVWRDLSQGGDEWMDREAAFALRFMRELRAGRE
ncbi:MAG: sugar phosphate isomerase/epimerase [Clostridiales bacterium]|nr:sugar phosphate isomerase/epimerase [Clostridiales bacterium]